MSIAAHLLCKSFPFCGSTYLSRLKPSLLTSESVIRS